MWETAKSLHFTFLLWTFYCDNTVISLTGVIPFKVCALIMKAIQITVGLQSLLQLYQSLYPSFQGSRHLDISL